MTRRAMFFILERNSSLNVARNSWDQFIKAKVFGEGTPPPEGEARRRCSCFLVLYSPPPRLVAAQAAQSGEAVQGEIGEGFYT